MEIEIHEAERAPAPKRVVGTQITQALYNKLKEEADTNFMSVSDLLRKIIHIYYRDKAASIPGKEN